jgi:hypothetical protein
MMENKKRWFVIVICAAILAQGVQLVGNAQALSSEDAKVLEEVEDLIPVGLQMVQSAEAVLSQGYSEMSPEEQDQFERIFDPSGSGTIDNDFVEGVLSNYQKIESRLEESFAFQYEEESDICDNMRLYYTDFIKIHICPYYKREGDSVRKARVLVHEVGHIALLAVDRPYYDPKSYSSRYNKLTLNGSWANQIPLVGRVFREISHNDTLYHPDAYAWFASLMYSKALLENN